MENKNAAEVLINDLFLDVKRSGFQTTKVALNQYNYDFSVLDGKEKVKVLSYFGKKGTKLILQGNENTVIYNQIKKLIFPQSIINFENSALEKENNFTEYIGTDESGKGDLFGPLVVAGFFFDENIQKDLLILGVRDSKELSDDKIRNIAELLIEKFPKRFHVEILTPSNYNQLYQKHNNLNKLLVEIHSKVISKISQSTKCKNVLIDKFAKAYRFDKLNLSNDFKVELHEKGEKFLGVAAASILARYSFIKWFDENKINNLTLPKGSSTEAIQFVHSITSKKKQIDLSRYAKLHFKTFRR